MSEDACRADVWLWRARFFKTRSLAAKFLDDGKVRLTRSGAQTRIDKCARPVKIGDRLVFALGGRLIAVEVAALGDVGDLAVTDQQRAGAVPAAGRIDEPGVHNCGRALGHSSGRPIHFSTTGGT